MDNDVSSRGIISDFCAQAAQVKPALSEEKSLAEGIVAVYVEENVGGNDFSVRALHGLGGDTLTDIEVTSAPSLKKASDLASQLAHENKDMRVLSPNPYIAVSPKYVFSVGSKAKCVLLSLETGAEEEIVNISFNSQCETFFENAMLAQSENAGTCLPRVVVSDGKVSRANFGGNSSKCNDSSNGSGHKASVTQLRPPEPE